MRPEEISPITLESQRWICQESTLDSLDSRALIRSQVHTQYTSATHSRCPGDVPLVDNHGARRSQRDTPRVVDRRQFFKTQLLDHNNGGVRRTWSGESAASR